MPKISRTTNPTDLKELDGNCFSVRVTTSADGVRSFLLVKFDLAKSKLEPGLQLDCIAHSGSTEEFFQLGTVEQPKNETFILADLATDRPLKFRFMIYKVGEAKLIAFADNIRAVDDAGQIGSSLVDIEPANLMGPVWRLEIPQLTATGDKPVLLVERQLFSTAQAAARDPWIAVLVMPEVMRRIAEIIVDNPGGLEEPESWIFPWAQYLIGFNIGDPPEDADQDAKDNWITAVVSAFCTTPSLKAQMHQAMRELSGDKHD